MNIRKKLIEVALPLEAINIASAKEKSIRHGHPSTLHLWWARRPLASARAVIFGQLIDDPSTYTDELLTNATNREAAATELDDRRKLWAERKAMYERAGQEDQTTVPAPGLEPTLEECAADLERERLFVIIRQLVLWENTTNELVLAAARQEIWKSWRRTCADNKDDPSAKELFNPDKLPDFHDPFAGGGTLPLEALRLGLQAYASDLNPVAVLINKAMIEIPPKFVGYSPVNPSSQNQVKQMGKTWSGAQGMAEDIRYYGQWMRDEAEKRIGQLYPAVEVTRELANGRPDLRGLIGQKLTVVAWIWARTVRSPNPAFAHVQVPLASTFMLSTKPGKEAYIEPKVNGDRFEFTVKMGIPKDVTIVENGTKLARGANFRCLLSGIPIPADYVKSEAKAGRMGACVIARVVGSEQGRTYLPPDPDESRIHTPSSWAPDVTISGSTQYLGVQPYGMERFSQLFTSRQLITLTTLSDLIGEAKTRVERDAISSGMQDDNIGVEKGGRGAKAYADAIALYLTFAFDKLSTTTNTVCTWQTSPTRLVAAFSRQAIPMTWDFAEANAFGGAAGDYHFPVGSVAEVLDRLPIEGNGFAYQHDVQKDAGRRGMLVSTDPPYYDNVPYADLSDFFYVWMRRSLQPSFPDLFTTVAVPKNEELVAFAYRHGSKAGAESFFLAGMATAMQRLREESHPGFPVTIYYAFKQSESDSDEGTASTGWETFLDAVTRAGFSVNGTWPMRTELTVALKKTKGVLASSIVLVCRPRSKDAQVATRREFVTALKAELPGALVHLQRSNIAPVDLAQAAIGPGMAIYTRYSKVLDASGEMLSVRDALALINQTLDEALAEQEGDFDADTRWALAWFEHVGFAEGEYGVAETLSKAKNTSIDALVHSRLLHSKSGRVRLLKPSEMSADWKPAHDHRVSVWEIVHHLIRALEAAGESGAAELFHNIGIRVETARELPYRLYTICERKKRAQEALSYNGLVQSWPEIARLAREDRKPPEQQPNLFGQER
jgi:putative DNA methylase